MSPAERTKVLLFLALFCGAVGVLFTVLSFGTEYWLLATETCSRTQDSNTDALDDVRLFHEGLFWRCSFVSHSDDHSVWDLWIFPSASQQPLKVCQGAFLFPFPVNEPMKPWMEPYEQPSAIVFRTFWSVFLVAGWIAVITGGFIIIFASSLTNHKLYKVGGVLQLFGGGCLLVVLAMYLVWVQLLDTLEQFVQHRRASSASASCPSLHLSIQQGPSFLLAPVAVFFCLLAGPLSILVGRRVRVVAVAEEEPVKKKENIPDELPTSDV